jgi:hypothetical protein
MVSNAELSTIVDLDALGLPDNAALIEFVK